MASTPDASPAPAAAPAARQRAAAVLRAELPALVRLAAPVVLAEMGWMAMGLVDTMLVGRVGAAALGGVSVGSSLAFTVVVGGMGLLLGLDTVVAQAHGRGDRVDAHRALVQGLWLAAALSLVLTPLLRLVPSRLALLGVAAEIRAPAAGYLNAIAWGVAPLFGFVAVRRYVQATSLVRPVMGAVLTANVVHVVAGWMLVFGRLGAPALGPAGAAWATVASRLWMLAWLALAALAHARAHDPGLLRVDLRPDPVLLGRLLRLGTPAAGQLVLEIGVFAAAALLVSRLDATSLAAHQIALGAAALAFMVPLGISSAAAVRVGHALGRESPEDAAHAGWTALLVGGGVMSGAAGLFLVAPGAVVRVFSREPAVVDAGVRLLAVAAAFALFDGLQVVATGVLRGTGDTRTPMLAGLAGYWLLGLPLGWWLGVARGHGVVGVWIGLCAGIVSVAVVLVWRWTTRIGGLRRAVPGTGRAPGPALAITRGSA